MGWPIILMSTWLQPLGRRGSSRCGSDQSSGEVPQLGQPLPTGGRVALLVPSEVSFTPNQIRFCDHFVCTSALQVPQQQ